jgi:hypothetical protein
MNYWVKVIIAVLLFVAWVLVSGIPTAKHHAEVKQLTSRQQP